MSTSFIDLGVPADVATSLAARGITDAFPIQVMAIPPAIAGQDVCGRAPTGSGKTIAFGIPIAMRVGKSKPGRPRALILAPTRELAAQIDGEMRLLLGRHSAGRPAARTASFYGGVGFGAQLGALRRGVDVAVACPGRLVDLVKRGAFSLADVEIVVIDEADRMADMGFLPEVKRILDQVKPDRQTLLFSATLDGDVDVLIKRYQQSPVRVEVAADESAPDLTTHHFIDTKREKRVEVAASLVSEHGSTVVFCRTKHGTDRVTKQLQAAGVRAVPIHGGRSQAQRDRALAAFAAGKVQALVATDVAARGIHVDDVRCVLHFDIATSDKDYLHRSGRTGRAGASGVVISLVTEGDTGAARQLQKALSMPLSAKKTGPGAGPDGTNAGAGTGSTRSGGAARVGGAGGQGGRRSSRYPDRSARPGRPQRSHSSGGAGGGTGGARGSGDRRSKSAGQPGGQSSGQAGRRSSGRGRAA